MQEAPRLTEPWRNHLWIALRRAAALRAARLEKLSLRDQTVFWMVQRLVRQLGNLQRQVTDWDTNCTATRAVNNGYRRPPSVEFRNRHAPQSITGNPTTDAPPPKRRDDPITSGRSRQPGERTRIRQYSVPQPRLLQPTANVELCLVVVNHLANR